MAEETPKCPCKEKLTDGEKNVLSFGLNNINNLLKNPNQAAIGLTRAVAGRNSATLDGLIALAGATTATGALSNPALNNILPSLRGARGLLNTQAGKVSAFEAECEKFTDPRKLTTIVSQLSIYADISCALGIEGLDIRVGMNAVNQNGQFAISYLANVNLDMEALLNNFPGENAALDAINKLQSGLDGVSSKLNEINSGLQGLVDQANGMQAAAAQFLKDYTSINSLSSLLNQSIDPCFQLGGSITGGLVSQEFINAVGQSAPDVGGTSIR